VVEQVLTVDWMRHYLNCLTRGICQPVSNDLKSPKYMLKAAFNQLCLINGHSRVWTRPRVTKKTPKEDASE